MVGICGLQTEPLKGERKITKIVLVIFFCITNVLIANVTYAEAITFYEKERGHCTTLKFNTETGHVVIKEYRTNGCEPSHVNKIAGTKVKYAVVIKNADASFLDYKFKYPLTIIRKNTEAAVFEQTLNRSETKSINSAISAGNGFNIGFFSSEKSYWAGNWFREPIDSSKVDEASSLKEIFNLQSASKRKSYQKTLKMLGFYKSGIDGLYGKGTKAALIAYNSEVYRKFDLTNSKGLKRLIADLNTDANFLEALRLSDDLSKHAAKMLSAAKKLVSSQKCNSSELEDFGGWVKSSQRNGFYFLDCGGTRHWINPSNSSSISNASYIPERTARDMCWAHIRREIPGASIQALNTSYTKHLVGSVTFKAGFKAKNIYGNTNNYYAYCLIQSDRSMEVTIQQR